MESTADRTLHPHDDDDQMNMYLLVKKTVALKIMGSETIGSIKSELSGKEGIPENVQELFLNGDRLRDDTKIADCGIRNDSTLHVIVRDSVMVKLLVVIPSRNKSITLEARTYNTIRNIKFIILEKEGILPDEYNLIYAGQVLDDNRTLMSFGVPNQLITLQLVLNPNDMISFSVIRPTGDAVNLKVKLLYSVSEVKAIVGGMIGIPVGDYDLIYQGKQLEDSKSVASCNVQEGSVLELSARTFQIFVKAWSGKTITVYVQHSDTIELVKEKVFKKLGAPNYFQSIVFGGKRLEPHHDLAYYKIEQNATLRMIFSPSTITTKLKLDEIGSVVPDMATTIRDLKFMIQKNIPSPVKEVYFKGSPLKDDLSIGHYKISATDKLTIVSEQRCY